MSYSSVQNRSKVHPHKFALLLGCASIVMMFAAWTSAYVVRQAAGNWLEFRLPNLFFINTAVILASSLTLHLSYRSFLNRQESLYKLFLFVTFILGFSFVALQYVAWTKLKLIGVPLTKNPSGDFVYVLTGFHAAHVIGGIGVLTVALIHAFALKFSPSPKRKLRFELTLIYWHFVDALWLYLILFLVTQS
ncbi:MAG: cytochrome oxidase subunit III [Chloroflexia bacterium]|nr:cytochrome oxidase subunit III [Chloroflexia bacterium]